jgi:CDP-diacylglycerol--serine O-phosphatidyltransferase
MKRHIPNILTLSNLFLGCIGIYFVFQNELIFAAYSIWLAALFDFLDGFAARLLKVTSSIGKELDSLADMVTFGVLPSFILMQLSSDEPYFLLSFIPLIVALFSALRLAKFNVDDRQTDSFIGLPTPASAFFVSGLPFWQAFAGEYINWISITCISLLLAFLMVAPISMLALKFSDYSIKNNINRYLTVLIAVVLFVVFGPKSLPVIITVYVLFSVISSMIKPNNT